MSATINSVSGPTGSSRIERAIANAAQRTGADFGYLLGQARVESGLNPSAQARTSSASGLYQFTRQTWLQTVKEHGAEHGLAWAASAIDRRADGRFAVSDADQRAAILALRNNPEAASLMAAAAATDNQAYLTGKLDRDPEQVDLYLAHFLGPAGAARFLSLHDSNSEAAAAQFFPEAAAANKAVFFNRDGQARSFRNIRDSFAVKLGSGEQSSPAQVATYSPTEFPPPLPLPMTTASDPSPGARAMREVGTIVRMPSQLSLEFARHAYERLAALTSGAAA